METDLSRFHYIVVARRDVLYICEVVASELLRIREFNNALGRETIIYRVYRLKITLLPRRAEIFCNLTEKACHFFSRRESNASAIWNVRSYRRLAIIPRGGEGRFFILSFLLE